MAQPAPLAHLFLALTALLACTSGPSPAQDTAPTIAGLWRGDLTLPGGRMRQPGRISADLEQLWAVALAGNPRHAVFRADDDGRKS